MIGKRARGQNVMVTKGVIAPEILDGMSKRGWILSKVEQQESHFHYNFIRARQRIHRSTYGNRYARIF